MARLLRRRASRAKLAPWSRGQGSLSLAHTAACVAALLPVMLPSSRLASPSRARTLPPCPTGPPPAPPPASPAHLEALLRRGAHDGRHHEGAALAVQPLLLGIHRHAVDVPHRLPRPHRPLLLGPRLRLRLGCRRCAGGHRAGGPRAGIVLPGCQVGGHPQRAGASCRADASTQDSGGVCWGAVEVASRASCRSVRTHTRAEAIGQQAPTHCCRRCSGAPDCGSGPTAGHATAAPALHLQSTAAGSPRQTAL